MEGLNFVGAGLIVWAALGIGRIGGSTMDTSCSSARNFRKIQTAMLIAALIEELVSLHYLLLGKIQKRKQ
jgi:F0F1-type ATP synthase membrane subunit c/vacuolar-type H+-ATPase subunit K